MQGMQGNARATYVSGCIVPGEYRELPGECKGAGVKGYGKGNTGECQENVCKWVQSARGMLGNAGECHGNVWEWV